MIPEIEALVKAKEDVARANKALSDAVWNPFCDLLEDGKLEEAEDMIHAIPECATRMRMAVQFSKYK